MMQIRHGKMIKSDDTQPQPLIQPNVYSGLENKSEYILFFNDQAFEHNTIESIICVLEDVRVSESYEGVKIYMSSIGGFANQLMLISDYLNSYPLDITFVVTDMIASCGSLLPLMVKRANIEYLPTASAMFHFAHKHIHTSSLYDSRSSMHTPSADLKSLTDLNEYLYENYYSKLDLTNEEKEHIKSGKDVCIDSSRMEHIFTAFKDRQFYDEDFDDCITSINEEIEELQNAMNQLESCKKDMYTNMEEFYDKYEVWDEELEKDGCNDEENLLDIKKLGV
ncbi:MAG: ATP-dependent Clp protease proteolytic subunit [Cetobacterium sp.]